MTVGATVYCRCYLDGKTTPPPVPPEWIAIDREDGWFRGLLLDDRHSGAQRGTYYDQFESWLETCCPHPGLRTADFDVNWGGMSRFREALTAAGTGEFPTLLAQLPTSNDGWVSPETATTMRADLHTFRRLPDLGPAWLLVDSDTGTDSTDSGPAFPGQSVWLVIAPGPDATTVHLGYDQHGLSLRRSDRSSEPDSEYFRAPRVEMRPLPPDRAAIVPPKSVEYVDLTTGQTAIGPRLSDPGPPQPIDQQRLLRPRFFHIQRTTVTPTDFAYIVDGLEAVCTAAIDLEHPIFWI